jgi:hypothetical protein
VTVKVRVGDQVIHTAAEERAGQRPDAALRKALLDVYPPWRTSAWTIIKCVSSTVKGTSAAVRA